MKDQKAALDFAYLANAEVATLAKQLIAQYYGKAAAYSYFSGCSTDGGEGRRRTGDSLPAGLSGHE